MTALPPLRREIVVPAPPAIAFDVFTAGIGSWWPLAEFSVHGASATVTFRAGEIVESAPGEADNSWGTVLAWQPPHRVAFTWHPGRGPEQASQVEVTFEVVDEGTRVRLVHAGWDALPDPATARDEYGHGWPVVLGAYASRFPVTTWTWVALLHHATIDGSVFADPRFAEHAAFLARMADAGYLVAAGPLGDEPGSGMTVLRFPGDDRFDDAVALATRSDASVVDGLFEVTVRPWSVVTSALPG